MSSTTRQRKYLQEMGITPIWVLQDAIADPTTKQTSVNKEGAYDRSSIEKMDWQQLADTVAQCPACDLCKTRKQTVFGIGDHQANWLLIGEAPGAEEDARGEPFVGQAGKLLDNMLKSIGLARNKNVYIANVLKCRPPNNRNPEPEEVAQCAPYLQRQIILLQPEIILLLGRFAAQSILQSNVSIANLRGKIHQYHIQADDRTIPVIVTYHPAYLLRNPVDKAKAWVDLCLARNTLQAIDN